MKMAKARLKLVWVLRIGSKKNCQGLLERKMESEPDDYYPNDTANSSGGSVVGGGDVVSGGGEDEDFDPEEEEEEMEEDQSGAVDMEAEEGIDNPQETLKQCLDKFASPDFIMEPEIFSQLKKYFQSGGNPEQVTLRVL